VLGIVFWRKGSVERWILPKEVIDKNQKKNKISERKT
jgi:hypothetical protein